jgi:squalene-associated FAD-dependent desaturase
VSAAADVTVVGGGVAGLSAAAWLAERGVRVELLEARPALGGRASTFTDPATGERVDNGQHLLMGSCDETFRFLRRIGSEGTVRVQPRLDVRMVDRAGRASRLLGAPLPAPLHLVIGLATWSAITWRDRVAAARVFRSVSRDGGVAAGGEAAARPPGRQAGAGVPMDQLTVREWLAALGQTTRLVEVLWEPLAVAVLNQSIDAGAAAPFAAVLRRMLTSGRRAASLAFPIRPLDEVFAIPAAAFIERHRGSVRTGVVVRDATSLGSKAIVCAAPWHALPALFPNRPPELEQVLQAAEQTSWSAIVSVNLWLDRPVMHVDFVGLPGRRMQWVFDKRRLFGDASTHLSLTSSAADDLTGRTNDDLVALALTELLDAIPAARGVPLRRAVVVREKRATFSVAPGQPGRPPTRTDIPGLFLAGDWIDTGLPATIEGAVTSGHAAAAAAFQFVNS